MKYHFKFRKEPQGYSAEGVELRGCRSEGNTLKELHKNLAEALNLFLSEPSSSKYIFPRPRPRGQGKNILAIEVQPSIAIANRIRELRLENELTQHAMKDRLGIKNLSNYQRLEDPHRANPEWTTLLLIKAAFPEFYVDDLMN